MAVTRRAAVGGLLAGGLSAGLAWGGLPRDARATAAGGDSDPYVERTELRLSPDELPFGGRVPVVLTGHDRAAGERLPLVIALHGLGESTDPVLATRAWPELYGLVEACRRLSSPPLAARSRRGDLPAERIAQMNGDLARQPFRGLAICCPFTPNPSRASDRAAHLRAYATFLETVIRRAREQLPVRDTAAATHLVGCSMGGAVAVDVAAARPGTYGSLSLVQSAHGAHRTASIAERSQKLGPGAGPLRTLVLTSQGDPFRARNEALAAALQRGGVPHTLDVLPGPHDQPWLREAGTPSLLLWLDRLAR